MDSVRVTFKSPAHFHLDFILPIVLSHHSVKFLALHHQSYSILRAYVASSHYHILLPSERAHTSHLSQAHFTSDHQNIHIYLHSDLSCIALKDTLTKREGEQQKQICSWQLLSNGLVLYMEVLLDGWGRSPGEYSSVLNLHHLGLGFFLPVFIFQCFLQVKI